MTLCSRDVTVCQHQQHECTSRLHHVTGDLEWTTHFYFITQTNGGIQRYLRVFYWWQQTCTEWKQCRSEIRNCAMSAQYCLLQRFLQLGNNKKAQLTQRERATAVHVWRPTANKCKIRKNLYFSAQGHSRSLLPVSIETRVWLPISD